VKPLVAPDGSVYYQLQEDDLSQVPEGIPAIPASEIIHDTMVCLFHPLVGISPIYACGLAATQGLKIQQNSAKFFENMSRPSGMLTAPAQISEETAKRLKDHWEQNFSGANIGKVAVLGDGLKYEAMSVNAVDAQMVEQLQMSAEMICSTFHVPGYKVGVGATPTYQNAEVLNQIYYSDCLQSLIESIEALLDEGLALGKMADGKTLGTEFELDDLLRMDTQALTNALKEQVGAGIAKPNEARKRLNMKPVAGGDTPYLQQQNYSLAALAKRDAMDDPFGKTPAPAAPIVEPDPAAAAKEYRECIEKIQKDLQWT
jgi:HK97 family phage portal protein